MKLRANEIKLNVDNPRLIKDIHYKKLLKSIKDFPEMADVREVIVNKDYVILGGNMRYRAMVEAGWSEIPVKVVDWPEDKQREFVIKDNAHYGDWDYIKLAEEWDKTKFDEWGIEVLSFDAIEQEKIAREFVAQPDTDNKYTPVCPYCGTEEA